MRRSRLGGGEGESEGSFTEGATGHVGVAAELGRCVTVRTPGQPRARADEQRRAQRERSDRARRDARAALQSQCQCWPGRRRPNAAAKRRRVVAGCAGVVGASATRNRCTTGERDASSGFSADVYHSSALGVCAMPERAGMVPRGAGVDAPRDCAPTPAQFSVVSPSVAAVADEGGATATASRARRSGRRERSEQAAPGR